MMVFRMFYYLFILGCAGSSLPVLFSRCGQCGLLPRYGVRVSQCCGLYCCRAGALGPAGLHVTARGLSSWGSRL